MQHFVSRNDMPVRLDHRPHHRRPARASATVDVGAAQLAMHSARELCGSTDPALLLAALAAALTSAD